MVFLDNTSVYRHTVYTNNTIKETRTRANIIALTPSTLYTADQFHRLKPLSSKFHKPKHQGKPPHKKGQNNFNVHRLNLSITNKKVCLQFPKNRKFIFSFRKMFLQIGVLSGRRQYLLVNTMIGQKGNNRLQKEQLRHRPPQIFACVCACAAVLSLVYVYICVCVSVRRQAGEEWLP